MLRSKNKYVPFSAFSVKQYVITVIVIYCFAASHGTCANDKYTEQNYIYSALNDVSDLVCRPLSTILNPANKEQMHSDIMSRVKNDTVRMKEKFINISSTTLKKEVKPIGFEKCKFFHISVSLEMIEQSIADLSNCADTECNREEEILIKKKMFLRLVDLEGYMDECVEDE